MEDLIRRAFSIIEDRLHRRILTLAVNTLQLHSVVESQERDLDDNPLQIMGKRVSMSQKEVVSGWVKHGVATT